MWGLRGGSLSALCRLAVERRKQKNSLTPLGPTLWCKMLKVKPSSAEFYRFPHPHLAAQNLTNRRLIGFIALAVVSFQIKEITKCSHTGEWMIVNSFYYFFQWLHRGFFPLGTFGTVSGKVDSFGWFRFWTASRFYFCGLGGVEHLIYNFIG